MNAINTICKSSQKFTKNPGKDFTRNRKISFRDIFVLLLCQEGGSITAELFRYFRLADNTASASAFVQQRDKILPEAFLRLFYRFTDSACPKILYKGLRLLAADGSDIHVPTNPNEPDSYFPGSKGQSHYNLLHLNALYDLNANAYVDAEVKGRHKYSEVRSLCEMVDRSGIKKALVIADRGYESYNLMAHLQEKGWYFLIRAKESNGIAAGFDFPISDEFDLQTQLLLSRSQSKKASCSCDNFRFLPSAVNFDFLPTSVRKDSSPVFYKLSLRLVRLKLSDQSYELLLTNLPQNNYPPDSLKVLYHLRWGIETSFRDLKYTVGMLHFHAKKTENILKEIFARIVLYNFSSLAALHSTAPSDSKKYPSKVNFSVAVHLCRQFILKNVSPPVLEAAFRKHTSSIRPGRSAPRNPSLRKVVSFSYRIA